MMVISMTATTDAKATASMAPRPDAPDFDDKRGAIVGTLWSLLILNTFFVTTRLCVNAKLHWATAGVLVEDYLLFVGGALVTATLICLIIGTQYGLGMRVGTLNMEDQHAPSNLVSVFRAVWLVMVLMGPALTSIKLTLLHLYKRVFLRTNRWWRICWKVNYATVVLWFAWSTAFYVNQCTPPQYYWTQYWNWYVVEPTDIRGVCDGRHPQYIAIPLLFGVLTDLALLVLPLSNIPYLHMVRQRKVLLFALFSTGFLACFLEIARICVLYVNTDDETDPTYGVADFLILTAAEEVLGVICVSIPVIVPHILRKTAGNPDDLPALLSALERDGRRHGQVRRRSTPLTSGIASGVIEMDVLENGARAVEEQGPLSRDDASDLTAGVIPAPNAARHMSQRLSTITVRTSVDIRYEDNRSNEGGGPRAVNSPTTTACWAGDATSQEQHARMIRDGATAHF